MGVTLQSLSSTLQIKKKNQWIEIYDNNDQYELISSKTLVNLLTRE